MQIDLVELLQERQIAHPSKIARWETTGDASIRVEARGFPWWSPPGKAHGDGRITFHLEGTSEGALDGDLFAGDPSREDLEQLDVRPLSEHAWARGPDCELFCSSALADPLVIYAVWTTTCCRSNALMDRSAT